jgi:hypothetical protein
VTGAIAQPGRLSRRCRERTQTGVCQTAAQRSRLGALQFLVLGLWSLVLGLPIARAHDPYEAFTNVMVRPDSLELNMTMAQATALRLIDPEVKIAGLTPENFPQHRPRLEREAAGLFILTIGRTPLKPRTVEVELTDELDVAFKRMYPRPPPGRMHIHAALMDKLGQGYSTILEVSDTAGHHLGWDQITIENPNLEVVVPPPASAPPKQK